VGKGGGVAGGEGGGRGGGVGGKKIRSRRAATGAHLACALDLGTETQPGHPSSPHAHARHDPAHRWAGHNWGAGVAPPGHDPPQKQAGAAPTHLNCARHHLRLSLPLSLPHPVDQAGAVVDDQVLRRLQGLHDREVGKQQGVRAQATGPEVDDRRGQAKRGEGGGGGEGPAHCRAQKRGGGGKERGAGVVACVCVLWWGTAGWRPAAGQGGAWACVLLEGERLGEWRWGERRVGGEGAYVAFFFLSPLLRPRPLSARARPNPRPPHCAQGSYAKVVSGGGGLPRE
jgi:hypothetical protein